jgi:hypothetical protein
MAEGDREEDGGRGKTEPIKVTDRRHFTATSGTDARRGSLGAERGSGFERRPRSEPEGVDFAMLVNAMAQPALLFLGEIPHPVTHEATVDLEQAKLQIDMLEVLAVKCRGNLTAQEEKLLDRWLYELRMRYVARTTGTA